MSKRKDTKGRNLKDGEVQRKDGLYMYRYTDQSGKRKTVYSWRLVSTDKLPDGKRNVKPLREIEKQIQKELIENPYKPPTDLTVNEAFERFIALRTDLKWATRHNYRLMYNENIANTIGDMKISKVKNSTIMKLYIDLVEKNQLKRKSVEKMHAIISQVFAYAMEDGIITSNPAQSAMKKVRKTLNKSTEPRHALTEEQQATFVEYVNTSPKYKQWGTLFTVLLGTGLRIGEALGLRWCDCDFDKNVISVNHAITYVPNEITGKYECRITTPKTTTSIRTVPMFSEVKLALERERSAVRELGKESDSIDGYSDFVFTDSNGTVLTPMRAREALLRIIAAYNEKETIIAASEDREPVLLPKFSPHNLRHTFCTRLCENGANIKIVQSIMGHSNITTTMDIYNEATDKKREETFLELEGKIVLS